MIQRLSILIATLGLAGCAPSPAITRLDPEGLGVSPRYSHATLVEAGARWLYVAGEVDQGEKPHQAANPCRHDDLRGQYLGVHENLERVLAAAGASWKDVVFIRRFVTDIAEWRALWGSDEPPADYWAGQRPPPSTLIEVSALAHPCYKIEIDLVAAVR